MKKFIVYIAILVACFLIIFNFNNHKVLTTSSQQSTTIFGRVITNNSFFYSSNNSNAPLFLLQQTYFIKLLSQPDETYFEAEYLGITGYVKKEDIEVVNETPLSPYLNNINFNIVSTSSCNLRSSPSSAQNNVLKTIPSSTASLQYIGKITGNEAQENLGNVWYYCKYTDSQSSSTYGYIYSPLAVNLTGISPNFERTSLKTDFTFNNINQNLNISNNATLALTLIVTLPSLFILYLLFKPSKVKKSTKCDI